MNTRTSIGTAAVLVALWLCASPAYAVDKDNNPPGPAGGKGTNWENPPGPEGGHGASPDRKHYGWKKRADKNHDGTIDETEKAAAQEKWKEKRAEVKEKIDVNDDGKIEKGERHKARKEFREKHDRDNNPPGPRGGKGTNWENPPGPQGGPGASPDRRHKK